MVNFMRERQKIIRRYKYVGACWLFLKGIRKDLFEVTRERTEKERTLWTSSQGTGNCKFKGLWQGACLGPLRKTT